MLLKQACRSCSRSSLTSRISSRLSISPILQTTSWRHVTTTTTPSSATPTPSIQKEPHTELSKHINAMIRLSGPISVAQYMRQCLVNPLKGYYMKGDVFGEQGDFITSPEISQMFGELIGIWFFTQWQFLGQPPATQLIEFGPGRGTLMADLIRILNNFKPMKQTIQTIHFIEASPVLRQKQAKALLGSDGVTTETENGGMMGTRPDGIKVMWHASLDSVPKDTWSMVVCHEFFDALPIYKFERANDGWREIQVDIDNSEDNKQNYKFVRSPADTLASVAFPKSVFTREQVKHFDKEGSRIEVSPDSYAVAKSIADRIGESGGCGLVIDYGKDGVSADSLRGIKNHKFVHPLSEPGDVDLSADVDFSYLASAMNESAKCYGPITQSDFLHSMGIQARLVQLLQAAPNDQVRKDLVSGYERLTDKLAMGDVYKFLAVTMKKQTSPPAAFEEKVDNEMKTI